MQGRGQIEIAEQPNDQNNFTAKVRIVDPQNGADTYSFTMAWDESGYNSGVGQTYPSQSYPASGGVLSPNGGVYNDRGVNNGGAYGSGVSGVRWSGQVDGRVRVSFRDNQAFTQRLSGQQTYNEQVSFGSPVPRRNVEHRRE